MAIISDLGTLTLRWVYAGQEMQTKRFFRLNGAAFLTANALTVSEAYWNHIKGVWRALVPNVFTTVFRSVVFEEVGGGLAFGEYAVPTAEQGGTRSPAGLGDGLPSFLAVGVRYTVGTRLTRPGQMRIPFLHEVDVSGNNVTAGFLALVTDVATMYANPIFLGAPVALGELTMQVISLDKAVPPSIDGRQDVDGYVVNPVVTSQLSRRQGRGR